MNIDQRKFEHLAGLCELPRAKCFDPRATRDVCRSGLQVAGDCDSQKPYEVPLADSYRSAINAWLQLHSLGRVFEVNAVYPHWRRLPRGEFFAVYSQWLRSWRDTPATQSRP